MAGAALGLGGVSLAGCDASGQNGGSTTTTNTTTTTTSGGEGNSPAPGGGNTGGPTDGGGATPPGGVSSSGGPRIRYDVASPQGQQMLQTYARAVAAMVARPEGDPLNWEFQWYSHEVKSPPNGQGTLKSQEIARIYGSTASAARTLAQKMWDGCQAHGANQDEDFFLPWHRMYVWAFENIIRQVSGDAGFTLPYWNYTDPSQFSIPPQFRMQADPVFGALYRPNRNPGINAGQPIADAGTLNLQILNSATYGDNGGDAGFCQGLDAGLHGAVHVSVGNATVGMGSIPWAANDPIFWLHHCNIDRIWASWNAVGNANPTDPQFLAKPFPFAAPDGAEVDYVVSNFLSPSQVGYGYDRLEGGAQTEALSQAFAPSAVGGAPPTPGASAPQAMMSMRSAHRAMVRAAPAARSIVTHAIENVSLGRGPIRVQLAAAQTQPEVALRAATPLAQPAMRMMRRTLRGTMAPIAGAAPAPVAAAIAPPSAAPTLPAPTPGQRVFLVVSDLSTAIQPGVLYSVYLETPGTAGTQQNFVGTLNFFSAMAPGMRMGTRKRSFDITDLAASLAAQGRLTSTPAVSFVPDGSPPSAVKPLIGRISVVIQ